MQVKSEEEVADPLGGLPIRVQAYPVPCPVFSCFEDVISATEKASSLGDADDDTVAQCLATPLDEVRSGAAGGLQGLAPLDEALDHAAALREALSHVASTFEPVTLAGTIIADAAGASRGMLRGVGPLDRDEFIGYETLPWVQEEEHVGVPSKKQKRRARSPSPPRAGERYWVNPANVDGNRVAFERKRKASCPRTGRDDQKYIKRANTAKKRWESMWEESKHRNLPEAIRAQKPFGRIQERSFAQKTIVMAILLMFVEGIVDLEFKDVNEPEQQSGFWHNIRRVKKINHQEFAKRIATLYARSSDHIGMDQDMEVDLEQLRMGLDFQLWKSMVESLKSTLFLSPEIKGTTKCNWQDAMRGDTDLVFSVPVVITATGDKKNVPRGD